MDDRIGCAVLLQVMKELDRSPHDLYFVFTVQEEVGLRGAGTSGYGVEPEIALAVDVTLTGDTPECAPMAVASAAGPAVKIKDGGMLAHARREGLAAAHRGGRGRSPASARCSCGGRRTPAPSRCPARVSRGLRLHSHALRALSVGDGRLRRRAGGR